MPVKLCMLRRGSSELCDFSIHVCTACFITHFGEANRFHDSFPLNKNALHLSSANL